MDFVGFTFRRLSGDANTLDAAELHTCFPDTCPKKLCYWGGFPSPRNCSVCICPSGFGGHDCGQRASGQFGAPEDCGATLTVAFAADTC